MNESDFTRAVNKEVSALDTSVLPRKVHDMLNAGWPDVEYISTERTLFVEYKLIKRKTEPKEIKPDLSEQQTLRCAAIYQRQPTNIKVVVTVELGRANYRVYVFHSPQQWENRTSVTNLTVFESRDAYVRWLISFCNTKA